MPDITIIPVEDQQNVRVELMYTLIGLDIIAPSKAEAISNLTPDQARNIASALNKAADAVEAKHG